ncbi:acyltransferase [Rossellomorea sp. SC111]|uniref:acyltransferase family protein n=1 Tax=Rossellomorea sp. SC111 TaxID=2968985 RepID=UPI00215AB9DF|nr:acyltransferase [Rossellomorea sp. SC111]MCR8851124.1 acyltransferase [Rossellomorea sp. SC111]
MDLRSPEKKFRPELEGVRTVAAFLVAIYHIWIGSVSGGVDVFFIVSGYLITTSLLTKMERVGRIQLVEYWLGLGRRLFPIAFTVLLFAVVVSVFIMPQVQWKQIIAEVFSSAFYVQNWYLASSAVDYLAQNNQASPLQHFWALSLQGQFYLTWPFVILLSFLLAKKVLKTPVRKTLLGVLISLFTLSIAYSVYKTAVNQPWAYFDTLARVWEFSLGGILALLIPYLTFRKSVNLVIGWIGLAVICFTGILLPVSTVFPGYAALLPTTGVIMIIIAAENPARFGVDRLLGSKLFMFFGGISYGFYLWHWPLLIFYYSFFDVDTVSVSGGLAIIICAFLLSFLSVKILEAPVRKISVKQSKKRLATILLVLILPLLCANTVWALYVKDQGQQQYDLKEYPGARAISDHLEYDPDKKPVPSTLSVKEDLPSFYEDPECFSNMEDAKVTVCSRGETSKPEYTIALVGGSHSGHWFPALEELSKKMKLKIDIYNKDACRFSDDDFDGLLNESCMDWNKKVLEMLKSNPPDVVFTTANVADGDTVPQGYLHQWEKLDGVTHIFAVRDNPAMEGDPPQCVEERGIEDCSVPRDQVLSDAVPWNHTDGIPGNVTFADLSEYFCQDGSCPPVVGNVLVYRDYHHISTLYSRTLAGAVEKELRKAGLFR